MIQRRQRPPKTTTQGSSAQLTSLKRSSWKYHAFQCSSNPNNFETLSSSPSVRKNEIAQTVHGGVGGPQLSHLISNGYPIYLFHQIMEDQFALYPLLFAYVFGDDEDDDFKTEYYWALMEQGMLKKDTQRFNTENKAWLEARMVLGDDAVGNNLKASEFKDLILKNLARFEDGGSVREWLVSLT